MSICKTATVYAFPGRQSEAAPDEGFTPLAEIINRVLAGLRPLGGGTCEGGDPRHSHVLRRGSPIRCSRPGDWGERAERGIEEPGLTGKVEVCLKRRTSGGFDDS